MSPKLNKTLLMCAQAALDKKACDLVILQVKEVFFLADYFVICSGRSERQVQAVARSIEETLEKNKILPLGIEGFTEAKWILMDYDEIIAHIFYEPIREFYDLESLWIDAPRIDLSQLKGKKG